MNGFSVSAVVLFSALLLGPCSGEPRGGPGDAAPAAPAASTPSATSAPATATTSPPSTVALGAYACTHDTWVGAMPNRQRQSTPVGSITLVDGQTYRWLDNGGSGRYRVDAGGTITWLDGPIAEKKPKKSTYRKNVKTTQIDVVFADGFDWSCGHNL